MPSPDNNPDLHGNVPDECAVALLLIDVLNSLAFEGGEQFLERATALARRIDLLRRTAKRERVPVIYVNDNNFGRWRSDLSHMLECWSKAGVPGRDIVQLLAPEPDDYVVFKPKHSGFYATPLETLLLYLRARRLVLAGFTTDQCVLFTASDAFLRDYALFVPSDCSDTVDPRDAAPALRLMQQRLHADVRPASELDWAQLKAR